MNGKIGYAYRLITTNPRKFITELIRYFTVTIYLKLSFRQYSTCGGLPKEIEIKPHDINYSLSIKNNYFPTDDKKAKCLKGKLSQPVVGVLGGPWDKLKKNWWKNDITSTLQNRYERGVEWEYTKLWQDNKRYRGGRAKEIDHLYESMKEHGYVPQKELSNINSDSSADIPMSTVTIRGEIYPNECRVGIGRHGEFIRFAQARHRLTIAKILALDSIPVIVLVRHKRWTKIRREFKSADTVDDVPAEYKQYSKHPDIIGLIE